MPTPTARPNAETIVARLRKLGSQKHRDGMARYAIPSDKAFGVTVAVIERLAREIGRDHALALALWKTGWYEARMLAPSLAEPDRMTAAQMDAWCRDFDNWATCDTACFRVFDRTPHAWTKVRQWATRRDEFQKRAAFALLASLALHDKAAADAPFLASLAIVDRAAGDDRNFVKKGVSWALRSIGSRSPALHEASLALARELAESPDATRRWLGKDAIRDLTRPLVIKRVAGKRPATSEAGKSRRR